jgi:uncharacterized membrane protein YkvA (DUF1232 family)
MDRGDFYKNLRDRVSGWLESDEGKKSAWAEYVFFVPDLMHLLVKLMADPDVPAKEKAKIGAVIAYFVSPVDLVPDSLVGPTNFLDDLALSAFVVKGLINNVEPEVVQRHWAGDRDLLEFVQQVLNDADAMLGFSAWNRLRQLVA